jgi:hypothetical protein
MMMMMMMMTMKNKNFGGRSSYRKIVAVVGGSFPTCWFPKFHSW